MSKKGFTLIELLGVIVILGLVAVFSVPALTKTFKDTADKQYEEFTKSISLAAENYLHNELDGDLNTKRFITVGELVKNGYLKKEINPLTEKEVSEGSTIVASKNPDGTESYVFVDRDVTETGYNRDGLLVLFDGYHNIENGQWTDLSGNGNNGVVTGATWKENYLYFDGVNDWIDMYDKLANIFKDDMTLEIVVEFDKNNNRSIILGNYPNSNSINIEKATSKEMTEKAVRIYYNAGSLDYLSDNSFYNLGNLDNYSYVFDKKNTTFNFYRNSAKKYYVTNDVFSIDCNFYGARIGADHRNTSINTGMMGRLYSVRIYNRALTTEEIYNNYMVDKYRFGLE